ncbi:MAG: O-antigen ligase family protein [Gemmatimonadaceae bacterium]
MRISKALFPEPSWRTAIMVLLIASLLVPVIFANGFFFPYVVPRNLYFRAIIEVAAATLVVALSFGRRRLDLRGEPILWALVAFLCAAGISAIFSPARMHSLFGDFERMGGVWSWLHLTLFFLLLRTLRDEDWPWVLNSALLISLYVSIRAITEHAGAAWASSADAVIPPSSSTLGNPGLLAAYMLLSVALAAYLASTNARFRVAYVAAAGVNVVALIYAENRSSLGGLVLGAVVGAAIFSVVNTRSRKKWIVPSIAAGLASCVFGTALGIRAYPTNPIMRGLPTVLQRLAMTDLAGADESRLMQWRAAFAGFRERPLLGLGLDNHNLAWSAHFDPRMQRLGTSIFDRTHNQFLEILATTGLVGTLAFLAIWIAIGVTLVRAYRCGRVSAGTAAVLWAGQIAYAFYLAFWFVDLNSTMLWIAVAALIASRATIGSVVLEATGIDPHPETRRPVLALASLGFLFAILYTETYSPLVANLALARVDRQQGSVGEVLGDINFLSRSRARETAHTPMVMAEYLSSLEPRIDEMRANPRERQMLDRAFTQSLAFFSGEIQRDSLNDRLYTQEGSLLVEAARFYRSPLYRQQAIDAFHKAIDLSPRRSDQRLRLAALYMGDGDYERAVVVLTDAVKVDPLLGEPRFRLAQAYTSVGKADSALAMLQSSLRLGYVGAPETYLAMGKRLEFSGRSSAAASLYSGYLEAKYTEAVWDGSEIIDRPIPASDIAVAAHLPLLYMRARESELAVKSAAALSAFDPSRTSIVDRFVNDLGARRRGNWVARSSLLPCATTRKSRGSDSTALSACGVFRRKL